MFVRVQVLRNSVYREVYINSRWKLMMSWLLEGEGC